MVKPSGLAENLVGASQGIFLEMLIFQRKLRQVPNPEPTYLDGARENPERWAPEPVPPAVNIISPLSPELTEGNRT